MPSSDPTAISQILKIVRDLNPTSILDIGVGCGKYGMLFREYLDGHWNGRAFHDPTTWKTRLVGLEVWDSYLTPVHEYIYDQVCIGDANDWLRDPQRSDNFDLVFMGDVIEHFTLEHGKEILEIIRDKWLTNVGHIVLSTPNFKTQINNESLAVFGNKHEVHRCRWTACDFENLGMKANIEEGRHLIVVLSL